MTESLLMVGVSHEDADVAVRESVFVDAEARRELLRRLAPLGEAVVLSTCNRTELYVAAGSDVHALTVDALLARTRDPRARTAVVTRRDGAVVRHLLAVAAGLRSVVPGEPEILGQVRDAFLAAERERAAGPVLSALFRRALDAGRRIRTETTIARRPASVASAAVELAAREGGLDGKHVVVLGAGRMARAVCSSLLRHRGVTVTVAARRTGRLDPRVRTAPFLLDASLLTDADVVVAATSASEPVVDAATLAPVRRPLLVIDLGMPRNVDPAAAALCALRDLDDLRLVVADAVAARAAARRDAAALLERHAREFDAWRRGRAVRHELAVAREQAAAVRDAELARLVAAAGAVDAPTLSRLERTAARHAGRWLHEQVSLLKHAPAA